MPYSVQVTSSLEVSSLNQNLEGDVMDHPLSPVQEHATEAIVILT